MKKIQEQIKNIKTFFYSMVSSQFKKNKTGSIDWYDQHTWFEVKWLKYKLKRVFMNFIYKLFEKSLESYFVEIEFLSPKSNKLDKYNLKHKTDYLGDFRIYMPIIIQVKNINQAVFIMNRVSDTLRSEYGITTFLTLNIDRNPMSSERFNLTINSLNKKCLGMEKRKLEILTNIPDNLGIYNYENPNITNIDIRVIKLTDVSWINQTDYTVLITKTVSEE